MKRVIAPLAVLALLVALAAWWFSDAQVLKRRTRSLLTTLTFEAGSGSATRQLGTFTLNKLLAPEVTLETNTLAEANGSFARSDLESAFSWLSGQATESQFEVVDFRSVEVDGNQAKLEVDLNAVVILPTYRPADGKYHVTFQWRKESDGWRITSARWQQAP